MSCEKTEDLSKLTVAELEKHRGNHDEQLVIASMFSSNSIYDPLSSFLPPVLSPLVLYHSGRLHAINQALAKKAK